MSPPVIVRQDLCAWKLAGRRYIAWRLPVPIRVALPRRHTPCGSERSSPETSQSDRATPPPAPIQPNQDNASPTTSSSQPQQQRPQQQQQPAQPASSSGTDSSDASQSAVDEVDRQLAGVWEDAKREMRKGVDPETAKLLDTMSYDELMGSNAIHFFKKLAGTQLGPILASMGMDVDPFEFLIDMVKLATFLQFVTCGMVWFGTQSIGHLSPGEAATATAGLVIGYLTRPAFRIELLLYPVYNSLIQIAVPNATLEVPASTREEVQSTLNRLGVTLALGFLLPQLLWGWTGGESVTLVAPLCLGWFMFDITYMAGLVLLLQRSD